MNLFEFDAALDNPTLPIGDEGELKCLFKIQSKASLPPPTGKQKRMTANICLVFDCSGSMAGKKRDTAIEAAKMIVDTVHERHRISLVGFATKAKVLVDNAQPTAEGRDAIKKKIDKEIRGFDRGTTNLGDGLKKAASVLGKERADAKVMVILSDGGADSPREATAAGAEATDAGIQLFAVGIGEEYEADRLLQLVTPSNGAVFGESDLEKIKATFEVLIGRIENFVATHASLSVTFGEGVEAGKAYKTSPEQAYIGAMEPDAKRTVSFHVGNIERDQGYGFLLAVTAPARKAGKLEIAQATLHYDAPAYGLRKASQDVNVVVEYAKKQKDPNAEVIAAFLGVQFVELAEGLAAAQRRGDPQKSAEILEQLIRRAREQGDAEALAFYEDLLEELKERGKISQDRVNALVLGSTSTLRRRAKKTVQLYDVVLLDPGAAMIQVIREIRDLTGMDLRAVSDLVKAAPAPIQESLPLADARALKKRIAGSGAKLEVRPR